MMDLLRRKAASLPDAPGVYLFKGPLGKIIYVGKAKSLKKRVQSYFSRDLSSKTQALVAKIGDLEYRLSPTESQAQILEASLIKQYQPQYNISLKDDKSFPWIKITAEKFPIVSIARRKGKDEDDPQSYFGPYTNVKLLRQAIKVIRKLFGFRSCKILPKEACLYYRLKACPAPCVGKISSGKYKELIGRIKLFLESKYEELISSLNKEMQKASLEKRFEDAAGLRDQINILGAIGQGKVSTSNKFELEDLKKLLKLKKLPERIEGFDISNISGTLAVGSMVSFWQGLPDKNNYRRFRIKTVIGADDYQMIREVVHRRYKRLTEERKFLPDLVLIDGGRGQISVAAEEIKNLGLNIPLVSIAKEGENIYNSSVLEPIRLKSDTPALNLIRRIRDEAHRFALGYHHVLRRKRMINR
ncbi:MAG: excinuclease ABC subunit UvrC [Candidatus Omnitrophota bacterium]